MGILSKLVHSKELEKLKAKKAELFHSLMDVTNELMLLKSRHPGFFRDPKTGRFVTIRK